MDRALEILAHAVERSPHNLVSRRAVDEVRTRHIPECVAFARSLPVGPRTLLDVGSGGGFPGLVVASVRPDLQVTLLEATRKKCEFLAETAAAMGVEIQVLHGRAEDLARVHAGSFEVVTARAVAPLRRLVGWTVPFLTPSGQVHAIKGARWAEEVADARNELRRHGARVVRTPEPGGSADPARPKVVIIGRA